MRILILFVLFLTACGKMNAHRVPQSATAASLPGASAIEAVQFNRAGLALRAQSRATVTGSCIQSKSIDIQVTGMTAPRVETCPAGGTFSLTIDLLGEDGPKTIVASSVDATGRLWSDSVTITKDATPPTVVILNALCTSAANSISGTCETGTPVRITGDLLAGVSADCRNGMFQAMLNYTANSGVKALAVAQADDLGNSVGVQGSCTVGATVPPTTAPVVTIQTPLANAFVKNVVPVVGACTNGIAVVLYGAGTVANVSANCVAGAYSGSITLSAGDGVKEIRAGQTAAGGLAGVAVRSVVKDTLAPVVTITAPAANTAAASGVTVQGACETNLPVTVAGAGVASMVKVNCVAAAYSAAVVFSAGDGAKAVVVSQTDGAGNVGSVSRSFVKGDVMLNGAALYTASCRSCHGELNVSAKRGRSAAQITAAIAAVPAMSGIALTPAEIAAIAVALGSAPVTAAPVTDADKFFAASNPTLYQAGRKYFPGDDVANPAKRIFRLTRKQLDLTVKSLLPSYFMTSVAATMPRDPLQTNYEYAEIINFNNSNIASLDTWIQQIAAKVRANPTAVVNCAASANSVACLQSQSRLFITKAFRGDIAEARITEFVNFFTASVTAVGINDATGDLVEVVLSSPHLLYRDEIQTDATGRLAGTEMLQGLTYTLADAPPEQVALSSSSAASLTATATNVKMTSDAVIATPEAREKLIRFFSSWLEVKEADEFTISTTDFPEFTPAVAAAVINETNTFLNFHLSKAAPKLKDITQSTQSFVSSSLASIYDLPAAGLNGTTPVNLDPTRRLGIFSQSAVLASHSGPTSTRLVKRGVFWARKVMCQELEPPPAGTNTTLPPLGASTERQRIEKATNQATCLGCHNVINPLGFFQENYNAIGKWRTTDNGFPVDAGISTNLLDEGTLSTNQPVEALRTFTNSMMFKQCFVRQLFRFYMGRNETPADHRTLREMFYYFADGDKQEILTLLQILSNSPRMTSRQ